MSVVGIKDLKTLLDGKGIDIQLLDFDIITVPEKGEFIRVRGKQFLPTDVFAKVASVVKSLGGEYVSAGKGSHFRVPPSTETPQIPQIEQSVTIDRFGSIDLQIEKIRRALLDIEGELAKLKEGGC